MIEYITGVPGSGKTYKAVYALYSNFGLNEKLKDKKYRFSVEFAYTNINEIDLSKFQDDKILSLDWDKFKEDLTILHTHYKNKVPDTELIIKAKELNLSNCLIILDECHNYLDRQDKVLVWWLSYHRHLYQQIYLITQNLSLVDSKYKAFAEFFYKSFPSSLRLFSSMMKYNQYTNSRMSLNSKSGKVSLFFKKDIYDSYHSGENQQSENVIKKFALYGFLFMFFLFVVINLIDSYWTSRNDDEKSINSQLINAQVNRKNDNFSSTKSVSKLVTKNLIILMCSSSNDICLYDGGSIPYELFKILKKKNKYKQYYYKYLQNTDFRLFYLDVDDGFIELFKNNTEVENYEKNNSSSSFFSPFGG
jgi:zona occludens toxin